MATTEDGKEPVESIERIKSRATSYATVIKWVLGTLIVASPNFVYAEPLIMSDTGTQIVVSDIHSPQPFWCFESYHNSPSGFLPSVTFGGTGIAQSSTTITIGYSSWGDSGNGIPPNDGTWNGIAFNSSVSNCNTGVEGDAGASIFDQGQFTFASGTFQSMASASSTNTRIDWVIPQDHFEVATDTGKVYMEAFGFLNHIDATLNPTPFVSIDAQRNEGFFGTLSGVLSGNSVHIDRTIPFANENVDQAFDISTSTNLFTGKDEGLYKVLWRIEMPRRFAGITYFTDTLFSTTTFFFYGAPSAYDQYWASIASSTSSSLGTSTPPVTLNACLTLNFVQCLVALFVPSDDTLHLFADFGSQIQLKPPFGYFPAIRNVFLGLGVGSTTATTTTPSFAGASILEPFLAPIRVVFSVLLWFVFGMWIFRRFRHFDFHL